MKNVKIIKNSSLVLLLSCGIFLLYYLILQPYHSKKTMDKYRDIYYSASNENTKSDYDENSGYAYTPSQADSDTDVCEETSTIDISLNTKYKKGQKNKKGILKKFDKLLSYNSDVKGWLCIDGTDIDYPVMQNNDIDYYLYRDFEKNDDKNGSLYIDEHCCIEPECKNIVIHGHNMKTTHMMFYGLNEYETLSFYREHPVITFDTLYEEADWKIISFMKLYGEPDKNNGFNYIQGSFNSDEDFLEFVHQIKLRSVYNCPVSVNENDTLLMLSTCSGALHDGRMVIVARKIREDESADVDTGKSYVKNNTLYPDAWYRDYGGTKPVYNDFAVAALFNEIDWYDGENNYSINGKQIEDTNFVFEFIDESHARIIKTKDTADKDISKPEVVYYRDHEIEIIP